MRIFVLASFVAVLGLYLFATQVPVSITSDKVAAAVSAAISEAEVPVDEDIVEKVVRRSLEKLDAGQRTRLTYLFAAYIVIWLVFMLYVLRLEQQQQLLDQRLAQLEIISNREE